MTNDTGPKGDSPRPTRAKKSETLEVRIPYDTKLAFLTACREDGTTASEVVRDKVQDYLDARERPSLIEEKRTLVMKLPQPVRRYGLRVAAGGIAAIGFVSMAALPSAATPDVKAQFSRLDVNGDGVLSVEEFLGPSDTGAKGEAHNIVIESRTITHSDSADVKPEISVSADTKRDAFAFWLPEELGGTKDGAAPKQQAHEFKFIGTRQTKEGEPGATATRTMSFSLDDIRKDEFAEIDADKDGKVSLQEYQARQTAMLTRGFEVLDANSDKALSEEEYARIVAPPMVKMNWTAPDGVDMPEPPKIDIPGMKPADPAAIKAAFARLDGNKDGKLSLQEYLPAS
jgi:Ca2+-binding EF-hand superfamily protein